MLSRAVNTGQAWGTIATAANTDLYSPNKLKVFLPASIVQMIVQKHTTEIFTPTAPQRHFRGMVSFEGRDGILIKSGGWLEGPYWSGGMRADVVRDSRGR